MIPFKPALGNFEAGKQFELIDATLTLKQLKELYDCIKNKAKPMEFLNPGYTIRLENILLIFDACVKEDNGQQVMSGAVTSREHVIRVPSEKYADACIVNFYRNCEMSSLLKHQHVDEDEYRQESTNELEESLIDLFREKDFWQSVTLKNVQLLVHGVRQYPSFGFHYKLLSALNLQIKCLKNLALSVIATPLASCKTKANLTGGEGFVLNSKSLLDVSEFKIQFRRFLTEAVGIENLNIMAGEPVSPFLQELKSTLIIHPNLKSLGFGNLLLTENDYSTLHDLLDENYNIWALEISEPIEEELKDAHDYLMDKSQLPGLLRLKQQQLTQSKRVKIAVEAIENDTINQLLFVIGPEIKRQEIVRNEEVFENLFKTLPSVYKRYHDYTKVYIDDFKLPLWEIFNKNPTQTVGCYLLKRAIEKENGPMIINLIEAGANLYEYYKVYDNGKSLLSLLNDSNVALSSVWKKTLAEKLKQDLCLFFPAMQRLLSTEIRTGFYSIKQHLDNYLCKWLSRSRWPDFVKIITGVYFCFEERQKDWENAAGKLANVVEVGTRNEFCMSALALEELQDAVEDLIEITRSPKCGLLGRSELNDGLHLCGKKLKEEIKRSKRDLLERHDSETDLNSQRARNALEIQLQEKEQELKSKAQENQQLRNLVIHLSCKSSLASSEEDNF